jgi:mRNA-degrading endonuclease RelE of RelBE toxin-antitoxin system
VNAVPSYRIQLHGDAASYLQRLPADVQQRFSAKLRQLAADPANMLVAKPLTRAGGRRSLRVGAWRAILEVDQGERRILVLNVGPRGQVYRTL